MLATPIRLPAQLGVLLRNARLSRGLTQADVAKELGITAQALSNWKATPPRRLSTASIGCARCWDSNCCCRTSPS